MGAIWVGTMSLVPKLLLKIGSDLGRHHIILPSQIAPMGAIWVGSDLGTNSALVKKKGVELCKVLMFELSFPNTSDKDECALAT